MDSIQEKMIMLHDFNPYANTLTPFVNTKKIVFRDISLFDVNATHLIHEYLRDHPHITVVSDAFSPGSKSEIRLVHTDLVNAMFM